MKIIAINATNPIPLYWIKVGLYVLHVIYIHTYTI